MLEILTNILTHEHSGLPVWNWMGQILGMGFALWGAHENSQMKIRGYHLWLASNAFLIVIHAASGLWVFVMLDIAFSITNLRGIRTWRQAQMGVNTEAKAMACLPKVISTEPRSTPA
jgi:hypothetical protein